MLVTKSKLPSVEAAFSSAVATIECARLRRASSRERIERGVKPRCTIWRTRVCSGGSMLSMISRWASIASRLIDWLKRITAVLVCEEKSSGCVETYLTSAWRVTAQ